MSVIHWGIVIDLSDITTDTNASIGLYSGKFYWITGRPGYAGSGYTGEAPLAQTWKEGMIIGDLSPMIRMTSGLDKTGGYGTLSGFNFNANDGSASGDEANSLNNILEDNDYFLENRDVSVYCFIDNVSYQTWGGIDSKKNKVGPMLKLTCEDNFKKIHKPIPPDKVDDIKFPNANADSIGEVIPVCFGNVDKALLLPVLSKLEPETLSIIDDENVTMSMCIEIDESLRTVTILTYGDNITENQFENYFFKASIGNSQSIEILSNSTGVQDVFNPGYYYYVFTLAEWFADGDPIAAGFSWVSNTSQEIWYFEIIKFNISHILSNNSIQDFEESSDGQDVDISYWGESENGYVNISEFREKKSLSNINNLNYPGVTMTSKPINLDGDVPAFTTLKFNYIASKDITVPLTNNVTYTTLFSAPVSPLDSPNLHDRDISTSYFVQYAPTDPNTFSELITEHSCEIPRQITNKDYDTVSVCVDYTLSSDKNTSISLFLSVKALDVFGRVTGNVVNYPVLANYFLGVAGALDQDMIPKRYYNEKPDDELFYSFKSQIDLSEFIENNKYLDTYKKLVLTLNFTQLSAFAQTNVTTILYKEIALVLKKDVNIINQDLYAKIRGETV